ncbi:TPA: glycosyltransferase family 9 protein [Aeromonas salmonicida]|nr:glycosyltransferase family 9 protein [Aeromonas salmonicida]HEH9422612.1 glycosyltransferase family 9 protein [Aeromonas salmonicida]HEH9435671.1 glycosyltransferase family 9 protein [Aeromonas salmonicida]
MIGYLQLLRDRIRRKIGIFLFDKQVLPGLHGEINHILVIRWDAKLGDSFVSSFFFRELKKLPNKVITVITTPSLEVLYKNDFGVDHVIAVDKRPDYKTLRRIASSIDHVDLAVHLTEGMKMKDLYFLYKLSPTNIASLDDNVARVNIKLSDTTRGMLFQEKYTYLLNMLGLMDVDTTYIIPDVARDKVISGCDNSIIINPFGSTRYKSMSQGKVTELLTVLGQCFPTRHFALLSSPATREDAQKMINGCGANNVALLEGVNTIEDAIYCIRAANVVISVDTAIVHIAAGLKKPLIAIYPLHGNEFNQWLPSPSPLTKVIFSHSPGINADMNNVESHAISDALSKLLSN